MSLIVPRKFGTTEQFVPAWESPLHWSEKDGNLNQAGKLLNIHLRDSPQSLQINKIYMYDQKPITRA